MDTSTKELRHLFYQSTEWRQLRLKALERDHYECLWCKNEGRVTTSHLEVDHIKELEYYPELALDIDNLRTLCKYHHNMRHERFQFRSWKAKEPKAYREDEWFG